jgi:hypothetical protein
MHHKFSNHLFDWNVGSPYGSRPISVAPKVRTASMEKIFLRDSLGTRKQALASEAKQTVILLWKTTGIGLYVPEGHVFVEVRTRSLQTARRHDRFHLLFETTDLCKASSLIT